MTRRGRNPLTSHEPSAARPTSAGLSAARLVFGRGSRWLVDGGHQSRQSAYMPLLISSENRLERAVSEAESSKEVRG